MHYLKVITSTSSNTSVNGKLICAPRFQKLGNKHFGAAGNFHTSERGAILEHNLVILNASKVKTLSDVHNKQLCTILY